MWKYTVKTKSKTYEVIENNLDEAWDNATSKCRAEGDTLLTVSSEDYDAMIFPQDPDFKEGPYTK